MKYLFTFFSGALFMSLLVIASNSQPGWMFLFGSIMASCVILVSRRLLGRRVGAVAVGSGTGTTASEYGRLSEAGMANRPLLAATLLKRAAHGLGQQIPPQPHSRERLRTATYEPKPRRAPTHCNRTPKRVQSAMLRPIQQDLLSALVNLGVPYNDAYKAALANTAASFDEAFKVAIASLNAGKRRAAA